MTQLEKQVWYEMARRKKQFHADKHWKEIKLWGLFSWGCVSKLIKEGKLITDMRKENKTVWVYPSEKAFHDHIEPLLGWFIKSLTTKAGWKTETK